MSALLYQVKFVDREIPASKPFIKWVGGKRRVIPDLEYGIPRNIEHYYEPFVGGGAMFFHLRSQQRILDHQITLSDINLRLIRTYKAIRDNVDGVIDRLEHHKSNHCKDYYYAVRDLQVDLYKEDVDVAAWFIYLNKTSFNGLYRVNKKNKFNAPIGSYKDPNICDEETLRCASSALQNVRIIHKFFDHMRHEAREGDFVYFDPPYVPVSVTSNFTSYTNQGFGALEQTILRDLASDLKVRNINVMLSNSDHPYVNELYQDFDIQNIKVGRAINSKGSKRGKVGEVVIT